MNNHEQKETPPPLVRTWRGQGEPKMEANKSAEQSVEVAVPPVRGATELPAAAYSK